jgi:hypothetical protein
MRGFRSARQAAVWSGVKAFGLLRPSSSIFLIIIVAFFRTTHIVVFTPLAILPWRALFIFPALVLSMIFFALHLCHEGKHHARKLTR